MKHFTWFLENESAFKTSLRVICKRITNSNHIMTSDYLIKKGWIYDDEGYYYEDGIKDEYLIYIKFYDEELPTHGYKVCIGKNKTFFSNSTTIEWFELFYLLQHRDNGIDNLLEL